MLPSSLYINTVSSLCIVKPEYIKSDKYYNTVYSIKQVWSITSQIKSSKFSLGGEDIL
jgi:hypothetical protein